MLRAAWKSLLGRKVRLLMSTFAIVLGVGFVAGTYLFTDTLERSFTAIFATSAGDVVVRPAGADAGNDQETTLEVPGDLVQRLASTPGAARVDGNVTAFGVYVIGADGKLVGGQGPPGIAGDYSTAPAAHGVPGLTIVAGHAPQGRDQVALDTFTAQRAGYRLGDEVSLVSAGTQSRLSATLVGVADYPEGGSLNGATVSLWDEQIAQQLFLDDPSGYSDLWITAEPGTSQADLAAAVQQRLPDGLEAVEGDVVADEAASQLLQAISFISTFFLVFAAIALVVGAFLIVNTFSILVAQRSRELALLRALGASRQQVRGSVLLEAVVLGLLGATLGIGFGVLVALGIRSFFANFGLDLSGTPVQYLPRTFLVSYAVGVGVTVVAAYLPARRTLAIPPIAALRDGVALPESDIRRRLLAGLVLLAAGAATMLAGLFLDVPQPGYWVGGGVLACLLGVAAASPVIARPFLAAASRAYRGLFGAVGRLAGQNSLRNPRRTAATASALMIGLALVSTMSIVGASSKASVDASVSENFAGDLVLSNAIGVPFSPSVGDQVAETDGVASVVRLRYGFANTGGPGKADREGFTATDPRLLADVYHLDVVAGDLAGLAADEVALTEGYATQHGLGVGDTMRWVMPAGPVQLRVAAVLADSPLLFLPAITSLDTYEQAGFKPADSGLVVTAAPGQGVHALQRELERQTADLPTVTVKNQDGFAAEQRAPIDQLLILIYALLGLALVIAVLGIVNTLALSIVERTREVGLLRAVGMGRGQLRRMVGLESVAIAVLGAVLGIAMGIVFGLALMTSLRDEGLGVIAVPYVELAVLLGASVLVGVLASVLPGRRAARLDVLRAISAE